MPRRTFSFAVLSTLLFAAAAVSAQPAGVTLYQGVGFTGERLTVDRDVFDLNDTPFGARRTRSVDVPRGCRATLFESSGYRGESIELTSRENDLSRTRLGRDSVGSLRVDCRGTSSGGWGQGPSARGVTLYRDKDLEGPSQTFDDDVPDLDRTRVGARQASSIEVPPGCIATLFSDTNYRGRSTTFRETENNLRNAEVGNDTAQSLRVDCGTRPRRLRSAGDRPPAGVAYSQGVTLFADKDFRGASDTFRSDVPNLAGTHVGAKNASSIRVPPGCRATLYTETDFRGTAQTFDNEHSNLRNTTVGNDTAQSMRVDCDGGRRY